MKAQVDNKTAPEVLVTPNEGLSPDHSLKGNPMTTVNPTQDAFDAQQFILELLRHAANDHHRARDISARYVKLGRQHGLTWDQLGAALDLSPATLRMRITRKGEAIK